MKPFLFRKKDWWLCWDGEDWFVANFKTGIAILGPLAYELACQRMDELKRKEDKNDCI